MNQHSYEHWVFMQEEPNWDMGPTGRPVERKKYKEVALSGYVPYDKTEEERVRIEDENIARHIAEHEAGNA